MLLLSVTVDGAGTNKQHVVTKNTAKLDRETEELKHDKVPLEVGKIIQEGRKAKGLKQSDLAAVSISIDSTFSNKSLSYIKILFLFVFYAENLRKTPSD